MSRTSLTIDIFCGVEMIKCLSRDKEKCLLELRSDVEWCLEAKKNWKEAIKARPKYPTNEQVEDLKRLKKARIAAKNHAYLSQKKHEEIIRQIKSYNEWIDSCRKRLEKETKT